MAMQARWLKKMANGTLGGHSKVANPVALRRFKPVHQTPIAPEEPPPATCFPHPGTWGDARTFLASSAPSQDFNSDSIVSPPLVLASSSWLESIVADVIPPTVGTKLGPFDYTATLLAASTSSSKFFGVRQATWASGADNFVFSPFGVAGFCNIAMGPSSGVGAGIPSAGGSLSMGTLRVVDPGGASFTFNPAAPPLSTAANLAVFTDETVDYTSATRQEVLCQDVNTFPNTHTSDISVSASVGSNPIAFICPPGDYHDTPATVSSVGASLELYEPGGTGTCHRRVEVECRDVASGTLIASATVDRPSADRAHEYIGCFVSPFTATARWELRIFVTWFDFQSGNHGELRRDLTGLGGAIQAKSAQVAGASACWHAFTLCFDSRDNSDGVGYTPIGNVAAGGGFTFLPPGISSYTGAVGGDSPTVFTANYGVIHRFAYCPLSFTP